MCDFKIKHVDLRFAVQKVINNKGDLTKADVKGDIRLGQRANSCQTAGCKLVV